ncbi:hypothetical protein M758_3G217800 [Ceratodon purpureus]|uniref:Secreted protein n=1 Tax=Ceratodon purpureus TaxID=3225 RepID=A0A8T0INY6_CERPU|nr:hypothetical protein KC19_3G216800 [Ceratodon purpureus]KAG0624010.1 hypothetical protein M758_3G217800 [Ceratodon purpureus]
MGTRFLLNTIFEHNSVVMLLLGLLFVPDFVHAACSLSIKNSGFKFHSNNVAINLKVLHQVIDRDTLLFLKCAYFGRFQALVNRAFLPSFV